MEVQIGSDAKYAVIGYGSWATAIAGMLAKNRTVVEWYVRNREVLEGLQNEGRNPKYLSELEFDKDFIHPSDNLDEVVSNADVLIISVPSAFLKDFLAPLTVSLENKFIVSAIKGIIPDSWQTVFLRCIRRRYRPYPASGQHGRRSSLLRYDRHHGPYAQRCPVCRFILSSSPCGDDGLPRNRQQPYGGMYCCMCC